MKLRQSVVMAGLLITLFPAFELSAQKPVFNGSVRARVESWNWFNSDERGDYQYLGVLARGALSQQRESIGWRIELAAPLLLGLPENPMAPAPQGQLGLGAAYWLANDSARSTGAVFLKQAFLRWQSRDSAHAHKLRLGRFEFIDGVETTPQPATLAALKRDRIAHRMIGNFAWSHVQRSLDGVHYTRDGPATNITLLAARPVQGVFNANGWPELNTTVGYGAISSITDAQGRADWRAFAAYYRDDRTGAGGIKTDNRPLSLRQQDRDPIALTTLGAHYLRLLPTEPVTFDLLAWGAWQRGQWGTLAHKADAYAFELGARPRFAPLLWLRAGYTRGSGDTSSSDQVHGTFFQLLPTPRWYARFPFYNLMNIDDRFVAVALGSATSRASARVEWHQLRLAEPADLWYAGGGAFESGSFGYAGKPANGHVRLSSVLDVSSSLRMREGLSMNAYLGWAARSPLIDEIYPGGSGGLFSYFELEWRR